MQTIAPPREARFRRLRVLDSLPDRSVRGMAPSGLPALLQHRLCLLTAALPWTSWSWEKRRTWGVPPAPRQLQRAWTHAPSIDRLSAAHFAPLATAANALRHLSQSPHELLGVSRSRSRPRLECAPERLAVPAGWSPVLEGPSFARGEESFPIIFGQNRRRLLRNAGRLHVRHWRSAKFALFDEEPPERLQGSVTVRSRRGLPVLKQIGDERLDVLSVDSVHVHRHSASFKETLRTEPCRTSTSRSSPSTCPGRAGQAPSNARGRGCGCVPVALAVWSFDGGPAGQIHAQANARLLLSSERAARGRLSYQLRKRCGSPRRVTRRG